MHPLDLLLRVIAPVTGIAVIASALLVGWSTEPNKLEQGFAPVEPLGFSHKVHAGDNHIDCRYCHIGAEKTRYAGIPSVETCMNCHRVTKPGTDLVRELTRTYEEGLAFKWKRVHRLPDHVYFDHRPHVNAGLDCAVCHGEVSQMESIEQSMSMRMGNCLDCHRDVHGYVTDPRYRLPADNLLIGAEHCSACHR